MKIGALIVTTGLPNVSGVTALLSEVGAITAGQRMIAAFQRADVPLVGLVVGPEEKKAERNFAQSGVVFLRSSDPRASFFQGLKLGLSFMQERFDRIFVVPGDTPLFLPQTLEHLLQSDADIVQPEHRYVNGFPILLSRAAMTLIGNTETEEAARIAAQQLRMESCPVEDAGILLRSSDMTHRKLLIQHHNAQLNRPVTEVTLSSGSPLYDSRLSMLLHLVAETRSVREACSLMQISYSTAWNMLNRVEDELGYPLVVRIRGGSTGSGSVLTEKGKALMEAYDHFSERMNSEARQLYQKLFLPVAK